MHQFVTDPKTRRGISVEICFRPKLFDAESFLGKKKFLPKLLAAEAVLGCPENILPNSEILPLVPTSPTSLHGYSAIFDQKTAPCSSD